MFAVTLVVFREVLEAAIIVGIVLAVTQDVKRRGLWISMGIGAGIIGALMIALVTDHIASAFSGLGQELVNGIILSIAVLMLGWTVIWMKTHAREIVDKVKIVGQKVRQGEMALHSLTIVIGLAVLREGAEIVLFSYGLLSAKSITIDQFIMGSIFGLLGALIVGFLFYRGILIFSRRYIFAITSSMLILLAAGMAAHAANYFVAAGVFPELIPVLWDSSWLLTDDSILGHMASILIGYTSRPSGIQLVVYIMTLAILAFGYLRNQKPSNKSVQ
jgi:high-affinity iron transporter